MGNGDYSLLASFPLQTFWQFFFLHKTRRENTRRKTLHELDSFWFCVVLYWRWHSGWYGCYCRRALPFLILAVWKHLFPRQRRDMLTYLSDSFCFCRLFTHTSPPGSFSLPLISRSFCFAFSLSAAGEVPKNTIVFAMPQRKKRTMISLVGSVLFLTFLLFFLLQEPAQRHIADWKHALKNKNRIQSKKVTLQDIRNIKQDYSKRIVIEGISKMTRTCFHNSIGESTIQNIWWNTLARTTRYKSRFLQRETPRTLQFLNGMSATIMKGGKNFTTSSSSSFSSLELIANTFQKILPFFAFSVRYILPLMLQFSSKDRWISEEAISPTFTSDTEAVLPSVEKLFQPFGRVFQRIYSRIP